MSKEQIRKIVLSSGFYVPKIGKKGTIKKKKVRTYAIKNVYNMRRGSLKLLSKDDEYVVV